MNKKICGKCLLFDKNKLECKVSVFIGGKKHNMPTFPDDECHYEKLGIQIDEIKMWVEDANGNKTDGNGKVKIEFPENLYPKDE